MSRRLKPPQQDMKSSVQAIFQGSWNFGKRVLSPLFRGRKIFCRDIKIMFSATGTASRAPPNTGSFIKLKRCISMHYIIALTITLAVFLVGPNTGTAADATGFTVQNIHDFDRATENPWASLIPAPDGNLYGTSNGGGTNPLKPLKRPQQRRIWTPCAGQLRPRWILVRNDSLRRTTVPFTKSIRRPARSWSYTPSPNPTRKVVLRVAQIQWAVRFRMATAIFMERQKTMALA